jgi:hypothetical protein
MNEFVIEINSSGIISSDIEYGEIVNLEVIMEEFKKTADQQLVK